MSWFLLVIYCWNNYRKPFFWNVNVDLVYKMLPIIHLRKNMYYFIPHCDHATFHHCHWIITSVMKTALLSKSESVSEVWRCLQFQLTKKDMKGGRSHRPVIMESTLLSAYHRLSDPNKCILSSLVYLALLLAFLYRNVKDDWERPGMWRSY